jgi:cell division protein FtsW (lipid II flippase)
MQTAAIIMAIVQFMVAMFQLALVLGAPMGEYAFGGQHKGKLPTRFRISSAFSFVLLLAIGGHYLAQAGVFQQLAPGAINTVANWILVGFNVVGLVMNSISRSKKERQMWVPVLLLSVVLAIIVAFGADSRLI